VTAKVKITYCAECGYEPQALALAEALMLQRRAEFSSIEFVPWIDGTFEVWVGDELIHSMERDGGFPRSEAIIEALRPRGRQGPAGQLSRRFLPEEQPR
jgi:selenoprotein W-related protein